MFAALRNHQAFANQSVRNPRHGTNAVHPARVTPEASRPRQVFQLDVLDVLALAT